MTQDEDLKDYQAGKEDSVEAADIAFTCMLILFLIAGIWENVCGVC